MHIPDPIWISNPVPACPCVGVHAARRLPFADRRGGLDAGLLLALAAAATSAARRCRGPGCEPRLDDEVWLPFLRPFARRIALTASAATRSFLAFTSLDVIARMAGAPVIRRFVRIGTDQRAMVSRRTGCGSSSSTHCEYRGGALGIVSAISASIWPWFRASEAALGNIMRLISRSRDSAYARAGRSTSANRTA